MKKKLLIMLALCSGIAVQTPVHSAPTDVSSMDNAIYVEPITATAGTQQVLSIKMKKHKMIQISLTPKNFSEKIAGILKVVAQIEALLGQIPYAVDIKSYGNRMPWRRV